MIVNLTYLKENVEKIQKLAPNAKLLPMVKGDAYGHGISPISEFLVQECGITRLGVASLGEALEILNTVPVVKTSSDVDIVVFSDTEINNEECAAIYSDAEFEGKIIPVCGTLKDLDTFLNLEGFAGKKPWVKVNTGMNRMGILPEALLEAEQIEKLKVRGGIHHLLQHFSSSWEPTHEGDATDLQFKKFKEVQAKLLDQGVPVLETSVANSGAIEQGIGIEETYVRPGLMMYGPPSVTSPRILWDGYNVSSFVTKVINTFPAKKGDCVGYGHNAVRDDCFIAVVPIGYADGFLRYNTGLPLQINGIQGEIHGFVNMDMSAIAFYNQDESIQNKIQQEDPVVVWSHENHNINDMAVFLQTNTYQLLTALSVRIPRVYLK